MSELLSPPDALVRIRRLSDCDPNELPDIIEGLGRLDESSTWPAFTAGEALGGQGFARRYIYGAAPQGALVAQLPDGTVIGRGHVVFYRRPPSPGKLPRLPERGWDQGMALAQEYQEEVAAADGADIPPPNMAMCTEVYVHPDYRGRAMRVDMRQVPDPDPTGLWLPHKLPSSVAKDAQMPLSEALLRGMAAAAMAAGYTELFAPVRPTGVRRPGEPWDDFVARDRWVQTHVRLGGIVLGQIPGSWTITGSPEQWKGWTDDEAFMHGTDPVRVRGGLVPVMWNPETGQWVYEEPNVEIVHPLTPKHETAYLALRRQLQKRATERMGV